jgi:hypothetical protein
MTVVFRNADLNKYPQKAEHTATHVSIGDMHGNALKLIYCLVEDGILSLDKDSYDQLRDIYKTPVNKLSKPQILQFKELIDKAEVNKEIALTLIGDELADRGNNDYFTLLVLKKLRTSGVHLDVLLSNHSAAFIRDYDKRKFTGEAGFSTGQGQSLENMRQLIDQGKISEEEVREIVNDYYVPSVKAINYTVTKEGDITLFTHAPVGLETVKALATYFRIPYKDDSVKTLISTIDAINQQVNDLFKQKKLGDVIEQAYIEGPYSQEGVMSRCYAALGGQAVPIPPQAPLQRLVWNRYIDYASEVETKPSGNFNVRFVHGHIGPEPFSLDSRALDSHENLDSYFGKQLNFFRTQSGVHHVVRHSNELTALDLKENPQLLKTFYLKKLDVLMDELQKKINELQSKGNPKSHDYNPKYVEAAKVGGQLFETMNQVKKDFTNNPTKETLQKFIDTCDDVTAQVAKSTLGEQRGIKKAVESIATLLNRIFTVITLGAFRDKTQSFLKSTEVKLETDTQVKTKNFKTELDKFKKGYEEEFLEQENKPTNSANPR